MENINIKDFLNSIVVKARATAQKLPVRELDEDGPGNYISFVDDGENSFDVGIKLGSGNKIIQYSCECKQPKPCKHIVAVLMALNEKAAPAKKKTAKKLPKAPPSTPILEELDVNVLKDWVRELLQNNKDIELAFINKFTKRESFDPSLVKDETAKVVKSIVKNKKNIDPTLLKKIFELWQQIHAPVIEYCSANLAKTEDVFALIDTITGQSIFYENFFSVNTNRFQAYITKTLEKFLRPLNEVENEEVWYQMVDKFAAQTYLPASNEVKAYYMKFLFSLLDISNNQRQVRIFERVADFLKQNKNKDSFWYFDLSRLFYYKVVQHGRFEDYFKLFFTYYAANDYNVALIEKLMEHGKMDMAEKECTIRINENYREEYSLPYLLLLKRIYQNTNHYAGYLEIATVLLPYSADFADFKLIYESLNDDKLKSKLYNKILNSYTQSSYDKGDKKKAMVFQILEYLGKITKMIDMVRQFSNYGLIIKYFDLMFAKDRLRLLENIIRKNENRYYYYQEMEEDDSADSPNVPILLDLLREKYGKVLIDSAFQREEKNTWGTRNKIQIFYKQSAK